MNEIPSPPAQDEPIAPQRQARSPHAARAERPTGSLPVKYLVLAVVVLAVLLAAHWWTTLTEFDNLRTEMARRLQTGDRINNETQLTAKSVQESIKEQQAKVSVLENKQIEAQSQQLALEQLYQDLAKNRDDWALAEIEQVLSTASQQLQLAGNVQGALIALQNADKSLSRSDKPQFIAIRRAIAKDLDKLRSLPNPDITGTALHLDSVIAQVDTLPLLSDQKPLASVLPKGVVRKVAAKTAGPEAETAKQAGENWLAPLQNKWNALSSEMWSEVTQLIRIRNVDTPDALLLSPTQAYYARENLKLRLLNARLALLSHNDSAFRSDMNGAQDIVLKYFDTRATQTQAAQALLRQIQAREVSIAMPTLADSLNAVRNYKVKP